MLTYRVGIFDEPLGEYICKCIQSNEGNVPFSLIVDPILLVIVLVYYKWICKIENLN